MLSLTLARLYRKAARSVRPIVMLTVAAGVSSAASGQDQGVGVAIRPAAAPANAEQARKPLSYRDAYDSIPFSRAEYRANPSYRHEAAMELVFGVQRPTTVVKLPAIGPQPLAPPIEQNFFLGLYPSSWALRLGQTY